MSETLSNHPRHNKTANNSPHETSRLRIWDIPVRLFHWSILILVAVSIYTGETGGFKEMDYHMLAGYSILALVLFRLSV